MTPADSVSFRYACAYIEVAGGSRPPRGSGYLVRADVVISCAHVVRRAGQGGVVHVRFLRGNSALERTATVQAVDEEADCAVLTLSEPVTDCSPLTFRHDSPAGTIWVSYGFPHATNTSPLRIDGEIQDPDALDPRRGPALQLFSRNITSGAMLGGLSGSPVVCQGMVVGHLKRVIPEPEAEDDREEKDRQQGGAQFGVVYACPARHIQALLGGVSPVPEPHPCPQPPKAPYDPDWYVARPAEEKIAASFLKSHGMPVVLWGPELCGKTWLLRHLLEKAEQHHASRVVNLTLDLFDQDALCSLDAFVRELALALADAVRVDPGEVQKAFARSSNPKANMTWLMEQKFLPSVVAEGGLLYLAIDRADAISAPSVRDGVYSMLRAWAQKTGKVWRHLRLLLTISTAPTLLSTTPAQSPFNLTEPIILGDFSQPQAEAISRLHQLAWSSAGLARLMALIGGHPYLLRVAMYHACLRSLTLEAVLGEGPPDGSVFTPFLRHVQVQLRREPSLLNAFLHVLALGAAQLEPHLGLRLEQAGLLRTEGEGRHTYVLRCALYERMKAMG